MRDAVGSPTTRSSKGIAMSTPLSPTPTVASATILAKPLAVAGLAGVAYIHMVDIAEKLNETAYIGLAYLGLVAGCMLTISLLLRRDARLGWMSAAGLCGMAFIGYILSRTTGLPSATYDIGNWAELSGTVALALEAGVVVIAAQALRHDL
jgi:hypothetical protein